MVLDDGFDFVYSLEGHGWSRCLIIVDKGIYQLHPSHVQLNPIENLLNGCINLLNGAKGATFTWYDEPGEYLWTVKRSASAPSFIHVSILGGVWLYSDIKGREPEGLEFNISLKRFCLGILYQMTKLRDLLTDPDYRTTRRTDFPHQIFEEFAMTFKAMGCKR